MELRTEGWMAEPFAGAAARRARATAAMVLCDRQDGHLALDLSCPDLRWLVAACRSLLAGHIPPGASMLKVRAGDEVYVLVRHLESDGAEAVRITNLYDRRESVVLPRDLAEFTMALLDQLIAGEC